MHRRQGHGPVAAAGSLRGPGPREAGPGSRGGPAPSALPGPLARTRAAARLARPRQVTSLEEPGRALPGGPTASSWAAGTGLQPRLRPSGLVPALAPAGRLAFMAAGVIFGRWGQGAVYRKLQFSCCAGLSLSDMAPSERVLFSGSQVETIGSPRTGRAASEGQTPGRDPRGDGGAGFQRTNTGRSPAGCPPARPP